MKTKVVVADFSKGAEVYAHIEQELGDLPIGILGESCRRLMEDAESHYKKIVQTV